MQLPRLSSTEVHYLKRIIRAQFPQIKNQHLLEAIARGFQFGTWSALNEALRKGFLIDDGTSVAFAPDLARARLVELGYPEVEHHALAGTLGADTTADAPVSAQRRAYRRLAALADRGMFTSDQHATIRRLGEARCTVMIAGVTGTGRSTLMRAVLGIQASRRSRHRIGLYNDAPTVGGYPPNVIPLAPNLPDWSQHLDSPAYRTPDGESEVPADFDTLCIDGMRHPMTSAIVLESWRNSAYGVATIHARPGRCLDRVAVLNEAVTDGRYIKVIDACINMDSHDGKPSVHSIEIFSRRLR
ncbi:hypothetical protein BLA39750_01152 [Burkholderia lata]|uniref:Uncharacterized protein n=2 Tax=Burkholderia lata (strain ATCC 17760 / DSM 23089 / LMG 22485 / NCIMB 9086 / R18194 / 383) TaxID=482957 RepID=A0A6P2VNT6_BURL3|nr:hypothetical protein BLA39750_01152 [Burkholderia lata]